VLVRDGTKGFEFLARCELSERQREIALAGGALAAAAKARDKGRKA
jgi:hypothetical protein